MAQTGHKTGVYQVRHVASGRLYIGAAIDIERRWASHRSGFRTGRHRNVRLLHAWKKYGADAFTFEVLERCERSDLRTREQFWLDKMRPAFNILKVAGEIPSGPAGGVADSKLHRAAVARGARRYEANIGAIAREIQAKAAAAGVSVGDLLRDRGPAAAPLSGNGSENDAT